MKHFSFPFRGHRNSKLHLKPYFNTKSNFDFFFFFFFLTLSQGLGKRDVCNWALKQPRTEETKSRMCYKVRLLVSTTLPLLPSLKPRLGRFRLTSTFTFCPNFGIRIIIFLCFCYNAVNNRNMWQVVKHRHPTALNPTSFTCSVTAAVCQLVAKWNDHDRAGG